jgi:uncharacterized protein (TIGR01732 family)
MCFDPDLPNLISCALAPYLSFFLHTLCRREGGVFMYGCNPYGGGYGVGGYGGEKGCRKETHGGSTFVLIVVLFILLIIVGSSFV